MLHVTLILEDTLFVASRGDSEWKGECCDALSGQGIFFSLTDEQMGAIMSLAFGGNDLPEDPLAKLYEIAEQAMSGWPKECRPIP